MKNWHIAALCALYVTLSLFGIWNHELWQDEAHHVLLGRDSDSISSLVYNSRYEGHPLLWNVLLFGIMHVFNSVFYVQLFHVMIATACVYLILKRAPFPVVVRLLIVFGYFMLYEYAVISRHYSLSLLLILLVLTEASRPHKRFIQIAVFLALLCNVHLFSGIIAMGFVFVLWKDWRGEAALPKLISLAIVVLGIAVCAWHIVPPKDHFLHQYNQEPLLSAKRFTKALSVPLKGLFPLPDVRVENYWNSSLFVNLGWNLNLFLSALVVLVPAVLLRARGRLLFFFYVPLTAMLLFFYATPLMLTHRNCGYLSILLLAVFWLKQANAREYGRVQPLTDHPMQWLRNGFIGLLLGVQFFSGVVEYCFDLARPFSGSKATAMYLNTQYSRQQPLILLSDHGAGPALAVYSKLPLFCLEPYAYGSFCHWNTRPFLQSDSVILQKISWKLSSADQVLLVLNNGQRINSLQQLNTHLHLIPDFRPELLTSAEHATVGSENYFVYKLK